MRVHPVNEDKSPEELNNISSKEGEYIAGAIEIDIDDENTGDYEESGDETDSKKPRIKLNRVGIAPESTPSTSIVDHGIYRPAPLELGSSSAALATTSPNIEHSDTFEDGEEINVNGMLAARKQGQIDPSQKQAEKMNTAEMAKLTSVPVSKSETVPDNQRADRTEARKVLEGSSQQVGVDLEVKTDSVKKQKRSNELSRADLVKSKQNISIDTAMELLKLPKSDNRSRVNSTSEFKTLEERASSSLYERSSENDLSDLKLPKPLVNKRDSRGKKRTFVKGKREKPKKSLSVKLILPSMGVNANILPEHKGLKFASELQLPKLTSSRINGQRGLSSVSVSTIKKQPSLPPITPKRSKTKNRTVSDSAVVPAPYRLGKNSTPELPTVKPIAVYKKTNPKALPRKEKKIEPAKNRTRPTEDNKVQTTSDSTVKSQHPKADSSDEDLQFIDSNGALTGWDLNSFRNLVNTAPAQSLVESTVPRTHSYSDSHDIINQKQSSRNTRVDIPMVNSAQNFSVSVSPSPLLPRRQKLAKALLPKSSESPSTSKQQTSSDLDQSSPYSNLGVSSIDDTPPPKSDTDLPPVKTPSATLDEDSIALLEYIKSRHPSEQTIRTSVVPRKEAIMDKCNVADTAKAENNSSNDLQTVKPLAILGNKQAKEIAEQAKSSGGSRKKSTKEALVKIKPAKRRRKSEDDTLSAKPCTSRDISDESNKPGTSKSKWPSAPKSANTTVKKAKKRTYSRSSNDLTSSRAKVSIEDLPSTSSTPVLPNTKPILMSDERKLERSSLRRSVRFAMEIFPTKSILMSDERKLEKASIKRSVRFSFDELPAEVESETNDKDNNNEPESSTQEMDQNKVIDNKDSDDISNQQVSDVDTEAKETADGKIESSTQDVDLDDAVEEDLSDDIPSMQAPHPDARQITWVRNPIFVEEMQMVQLRSKERDVDGFPVAANGGDKDRGWWKKVKELFKRKDCETKKPMRMSRICNKSEQKIKSNQQHEKLGVSAVKIEKEKMIKERTSLEAQIDSLRNKEKDRRKAYKKSIKDMKVRAKDIKKKIGSEKERLRAELQMDKDRLKIMAEDEKKKSKEEMKELQERLNKIEKDRKALKKATRR